MNTFTYQYARRRKHIDGGFTAKYVLDNGVFIPENGFREGQIVYHRCGGNIQLKLVLRRSENLWECSFDDGLKGTYHIDDLLLEPIRY